ncbi:type VII secretion protein EssB [Metabacillus fastidiosus]|uniref:type VII secretion protein EssB n=1 Tax=Metabacillus fastidiosus TaxID=1458 RepID=UPI003D2E5361
MEETNKTYLEQQLDAIISKEENGDFVFVFQRARLKMQHQLEIQMLETLDKPLHRKIEETEDEVKITIQKPSSFFDFNRVKKKNAYARLVSAGQLVNKAANHSLKRINLIICPENLIFDQSLTPYFLHYGVNESIPPYEEDSARLLQEVKAVTSVLVDGQYDFEDYLKYVEVMKLSDKAKLIQAADSLEELSETLKQFVTELEEKEKHTVYLPKKKWQVQRYVFWGTIILLIPAIIYSFYSVLFIQPKQDAYVKGNEYFLREKYSNVIDVLNQYSPEGMPYSVQYELAFSYVLNEELGELQKENVQKTITLQTDPDYFVYWIYIGRGMNKEAIDLARSLEDRDLIRLGLIKYREDIKAMDKLTGEEKEKEIEAITEELKQFEREIEEERKLEEEKRLEEEERMGPSAPEEAESEQEAAPPKEQEANKEQSPQQQNNGEQPPKEQAADNKQPVENVPKAQ